ncbi:MAG: hypothetical protein KAJ40_07565 [Alphaproteobacteria bacterium]|nr:hypothetical protein [Alphaproteobacteria bacterium]
MRVSSSFHHLVFLSSILVLGSCAYTTKASYQDITFLSPDGQDAQCFVYINKIKYQVWTPQTINVKKSSKPMKVSCNAPGNRDIEVEVHPRIETVALWGTPVGMAWDYASDSLYSYPDVIAIDFSQETIRPLPLPKHNNEDIRQPESYDLEEFLPNEPRLNSDKNNKTMLLLRRDKGSEIDGSRDESESSDDEDSLMPSDVAENIEFDGGISNEGDLEAVIEEIRETPTAELQDSEAVSIDVEIDIEVAGEKANSVAEEAGEATVMEAESDSVAESDAGPTDSDSEDLANSAPVVLVPGE